MGCSPGQSRRPRFTVLHVDVARVGGGLQQPQLRPHRRRRHHRRLKRRCCRARRASRAARSTPRDLRSRFQHPTATRGQAPVTVACSPASGSTFPIGLTTVRCTATDALQRQATCEFNVTVTKLPQLSRPALHGVRRQHHRRRSDVSRIDRRVDQRQAGRGAGGGLSDGARAAAAVAVSIPGRSNLRVQPGRRRREGDRCAQSLLLGDDAALRPDVVLHSQRPQRHSPRRRRRRQRRGQ